MSGMKTRGKGKKEVYRVGFWNVDLKNKYDQFWKRLDEQDIMFLSKTQLQRKRVGEDKEMVAKKLCVGNTENRKKKQDGKGDREDDNKLQKKLKVERERRERDRKEINVRESVVRKELVEINKGVCE